MYNDFMTTTQAAAQFGLSAQTLQIWRKKGIGPNFSKIGKAVLYCRKDIEAYMDQMKNGKDAHSKGTL